MTTFLDQPVNITMSRGDWEFISAGLQDQARQVSNQSYNVDMKVTEAEFKANTDEVFKQNWDLVSVIIKACVNQATDPNNPDEVKVANKL